MSAGVDFIAAHDRTVASLKRQLKQQKTIKEEALLPSSPIEPLDDLEPSFPQSKPSVCALISRREPLVDAMAEILARVERLSSAPALFLSRSTFTAYALVTSARDPSPQIAQELSILVIRALELFKGKKIQKWKFPNAFLNKQLDVFDKHLSTSRRHTEADWVAAYAYINANETWFDLALFPLWRGFALIK